MLLIVTFLDNKVQVFFKLDGYRTAYDLVLKEKQSATKSIKYKE